MAPYISIHALLAESDDTSGATYLILRAFLSTLSLRRATMHALIFAHSVLFLSTLSLRRATPPPTSVSSKSSNFYPRSPCGERPFAFRIYSASFYFYPRSPCGERPGQNLINGIRLVFLSTLSLRRATFMFEEQKALDKISIHALLAESDGRRSAVYVPDLHFYPRSPCGERQPIARQSGPLLDFYPRSPCGERRHHQP